MRDDLPTIEFITKSGEHRRVRYERAENAPWRIERHVDRPDGDGGWVPAGGEPLRALRVDGEHRGVKDVVALSHGGGHE